MKKLFIILTIVALTTTASFGQFSAKMGLNMANFTANDGDAENGIKLGMIIGASYAMERYNDEASLDIAVAFKQSNIKETYEYTIDDVTYKGTYTLTTVNYLDISPSFSYYVSDAFSLSFGPYLAYAISGKIKIEYDSANVTTTLPSKSIKFGDGANDDGIKALDFGINIGAVYSINDAMSVSAGYSSGLTNILSNLLSINIDIDDDEKALLQQLGIDLPSIKNSGFYICVAYTFGG